jgi:hypothetical protein
MVEAMRGNGSTSEEIAWAVSAQKEGFGFEI